MTNGKGDRPRPVNRKQYEMNYEDIAWRLNEWAIDDHNRPSVLVGCECSGRVAGAFRDVGCEAYSCDTKAADHDHPCPQAHIQGDVFDAIESRTHWDIIILHPPCTALAVSGNRWYGTGREYEPERHEAMTWTEALWRTAKEHASAVALENPVGVLPHVIGKASQYIQPWQFGHPESKKTGLWLWGLDLLRPTNVLEVPSCGYWKNQTPSGQNKLGPSPQRASLRSLTYQGIADAMAQQWGVS